MRIVLFGAPGSGKGHPGRDPGPAHGLPRISTGDLLRRAVKDRTPLGLKAEAFMKAGGLVSDDIVIGLVRERIAAARLPPRLHPRRIPPDDRPGRGRWPMDPAGPSSSSASRSIRRSWSAACAAGGSAACQAVYNLTAQPPARPGVCDVCGGPSSSGRTTPPRSSGRGCASTWPRPSRSRRFYRRERGLPRRDGEGTIESIAAEIARI